MFDPVGTEEKHGFKTATFEAFDTFHSILKIKMLTVQVNGDEMAWVCENFFGGAVDIDCPAPETCCDGGDIEAEQIQLGHAWGFLQ